MRTIIIPLALLLAACGEDSKVVHRDGIHLTLPVTCTYTAVSNGSVSECSDGATILIINGVGTYNSTSNLDLCLEGQEQVFKTGAGQAISLHAGVLSLPSVGTWRASLNGTGCQYYVDPSGTIGDNSGQTL